MMSDMGMAEFSVELDSLDSKSLNEMMVHIHGNQQNIRGKIKECVEKRKMESLKFFKSCLTSDV
jgi:hypothetical protein